MWKAIIIIVAALALLGVFAWLASYFKWFEHPRFVENDARADDAADQSEECCGQHAVCEKNRKTMARKDIVYYNDEELDAYRQMSPEQYDDVALEAFSEVFYTLREEDVFGWLESLRMRQIEPPMFIRDEALLIMSENRYQPTSVQ